MFAIRSPRLLSTFFVGTICLLALTIAAFMPASPAHAGNSKFTLCFPQVTWFGGTSPVIDGNIQEFPDPNNPNVPFDPGWRGAVRYDAQTLNGTPSPEVVIQGIRDAGNLYLSFEVHKSVQFDNADMIALAFDPTGITTDMRLIEIYPVTTGQGSNQNQPPHQIDYGIFQGGSWTLGQAAPSWLTPTNVKLDAINNSNGNDYVYTLELKIPFKGVQGAPADAFLPAGSNFGFYIDVFRVQSINTISEEVWPSDAPNMSGFQTNVPNPTSWGTGVLTGSPCNGVFISNADITANGGTTQLKFPPATNTFSVVVHNSSISSAGQPVLAPQIQPTFRIGNFGLTAANQWQQIPTGNNPPPAQDIPASLTVTFQTQPWLISDPNQLANFMAHPHQCVMVTLESHPPGTTAPTCTGANKPPECLKATIINNAAVQNMNFGTLQMGNMFRGVIAQIGAKGFALPKGRTTQIFDLMLRTREVAIREHEDIARAATIAGPRRSLIFTVHGYRHTGTFIVINKRKFEIVESAGAFGYALTYEAPELPKWRFQFFGEKSTKLERIADHGYRVQVPAGKVAFVNGTFQGDYRAPMGGPEKE